MSGDFRRLYFSTVCEGSGGSVDRTEITPEHMTDETSTTQTIVD